MIDFINFYLVPGITLGSIYALGAVGISMIFGILRFAHFAHGDLMTVGAYAALTAVWVLGVPALAAIPVAIAVTCIVALFADRLFYKPLRDLPTIYTVIASFGIALVLRSLVQTIWGTESQVYMTGFQKPMVLFDTFRLATRHVQIIISTAVLTVALHLFLTRTVMGKSMRAVADDHHWQALQASTPSASSAGPGSSARHLRPSPACSSVSIPTCRPISAGTCCCPCSHRPCLAASASRWAPLPAV